MKYRYKTRPYPHQARVTKRMLRQRGGGLQVPMRYGKTKIAIDWAGAMHLLRARDGDKRRFPTRVLVITVTDGVAVWHNEIAKHCAVPWMMTTGEREPEERWNGGSGEFIRKGTPEEDEYVRHNDGLWWRVINWQTTYAREPTGRGREWVPIERGDLRRWRPTLVIVDESHHAGNPSAEQSKAAYHLCRLADGVLIMTGTMFHRRPEFVFGQAKLYDPGIFGSDWGHFKKRVCVMGGYGGYEILRYRNLRWMTNKLKPWVHMQEHVPKTPPVVNVIPAPLTGRNLDVYRKMEKDAIVRLGDAHSTADIILTKHLRLQQIAGGWARTEDGYKRVGRCKLDMAASRLREYGEQDITKAVIGCRFLPELIDLAKLAKRIGFRPILFHGRLPKKGDVRARRIDDFNTADDPVLFIAQIRAAREAIDLSSASTMMLYSLTESFLDYDQFTSRIEVFDDDRTLMYDHMVAPGTRDEVTWESMKEKQDVARFIAKDPERVEAIVAANVDRRLSERKTSA